MVAFGNVAVVIDTLAGGGGNHSIPHPAKHMNNNKQKNICLTIGIGIYGVF